MILVQQWSKKTESLIKRMAGLASGFLIILLLARSTDAKELFSKQYGLACKQCHTKIPNLREFGQNFKNNGYSLEKKVPVPMDTPGSSESPVVQQQISSVVNSQKETNVKSIEDSALKAPSPPPPPTPEFFYRLRSKDGTYIFTDQPIRVFGTYNADKTIKTAKASQKSLGHGVTTRKNVFSGRTKEKRRKGSTASVKSANTQKRGGLEHVEHPIAQIHEALPHNFEECMEKILIKMDQPKDGKELMKLFERAEHSCASYARSH